jgi:NAD(P)H dehydrogenase (quinone)
MRYLITGVDGQLGGRVAENMLKVVEPNNLVFTCPDMKRLKSDKLKNWLSLGISVKEANYDNAEQLAHCFSDVDRMFMVSGILNGLERVKQHINVIDAALASGVKHLTYTSFFGANRPNYNQYVLPDHTETERYIQSSGIKYNIMRNNLYLENYFTNSVLFANISNGKWCTSAGEGSATFIAKDDSGRVATALLLGKGEENTAYDVTGQLISQRDICKMISEYSGVHLEYTPLSNEDYFDYLDSIHVPRGTSGDYSQSPVPWCSNDMVTNEAGIRDGLMAIETDTVELLTGKKPVSPDLLLEKYAVVWQEKLTNYWDMVKRIN